MKPASKLRRRLLIVVGLIALYTVIGFFLAPVIVKSQLEKRLSAELGRRVTVEKVRTNPYAISLTLENFAIRERDGTSKFVDWRRLYVNVDVWHSIWSAWSLSEIDLDGFDARIAVNADSSLNFADILTKLDRPAAAPATPPAAAQPGRPVRVDRVHVANARIDFSDAAARQPFATTLGPVTFTLANFHTTSETGAPHHFEAVTEAGEKFTWSGTLHATPLRSRGEFSVENIVLAKYMPYYPHQVNAEIAGGTLSVRGRYEASLAPGQTVLQLLDGGVQLRGLKVLESPQGESALELAALDVSGIEADAMTQKAKVATVALTGGLARLRREKNGTLNVQTMLQPDPAAPKRATPSPPPSTAAPAPAIKPEVTVGEFALKDFRVDVTDLAAPHPAKLGLGGIEFTLRDITLAEGAKMPLQFAADWVPAGALRLAGQVGIAPHVSATLDLDVTGLDLLPLNPYLETFANADLTQGAFTAKLKLTAELREGQPLAATVAGDVTVEKFALVDGTHSEELAGFQTFALRGLRAATAPELSLALDEVNIAAPYARVVVNADKSINLASVARLPTPPAAGATPASAPVPSPTAPAAPTPKIDVAKLVITGGDYRFTDRSIEPHVTMAMSEFSGTVAGLSSANLAKADLDLKAVVNGAGPVAITGKVDPLGTKPSFRPEVRFQERRSRPAQPLQRQVRRLRTRPRETPARREVHHGRQEDRRRQRDHAEPIHLRRKSRESRRHRPPRPARRRAAQGPRRQDRHRRARAGQHRRSQLQHRPRSVARDRQPPDEGRRIALFPPRGPCSVAVAKSWRSRISLRAPTASSKRSARNWKRWSRRWSTGPGSISTCRARTTSRPTPLRSNG
jgi:uncharacterized protein involved in outer membrane biogenesis